MLYPSWDDRFQAVVKGLPGPVFSDLSSAAPSPAARVASAASPASAASAASAAARASPAEGERRGKRCGKRRIGLSDRANTATGNRRPETKQELVE